MKAGELHKHGHKIKLSGQPFEILALLLERPGEVVTREELHAKLWAENTFVDFDHSLHAAINRLREALGDSSEQPKYIETLPRRGYRFIGAVDGQAEARAREATAGAAKPSAKRWLIWGTALILLTALAGVALTSNLWRLRERVWGSASAPGIHSLAVLPLANLSGDPEQEYFVEGMTDELITQLAQIGKLRVISRSTAMQYKGTRKSVRDIGRELRVDGIVEGTVFRWGERVRISAQLVDASTDQHLWAQSYERDLRDVLALQKDVAAGVAQQIRIKLLPGEQPRAVNPEAYEAYLRGRHDLNTATSEAYLERSIANFKSAIAKDPSFVLAYSGLLALSYVALADYYRPPHEAMPQAEEAARKALELDQRLSEAHDALGFVEFIYRWNWAAAEQHLKRAIELNPGNALAQDHYANYLSSLGHHAEAFSTSERARGLDPLSLLIQANSGLYRFNGRDYEGAIERERKALELDPNCTTCRVYLSLAYAQKQRFPESLREARLVHLPQAAPIDVAGAAGVIAAAGQRAEAEAVLRRVQQLRKQRFVCPYEIATAYLALGEKDKALYELENAYQAHSICMVWLKDDPRLDPLRSDPHFQELLRRLRMPA